MRIKILILFMFLALGVNAQFALTTDTLKLYRGGQLYYLSMSGDTLFLNSDTIVGVSVANLSAIYDTLGIHLDTLQALRVNTNTNTNNIAKHDDSLAVHLDSLQALRSNTNTNTNSISVINDTIPVHRTDINNNANNISNLNDTIALHLDTLGVHRVDINALNPVVGIDATNPSKVALTFLDGSVVYESWGHDHSQYEPLRENSYGQISMTTGDTTNLATIGTDYLVNGTFQTSCSCKMFTQNADGTLTYNGAGGKFLLNGTSDLAADKASKITYTLYMDEVADGNTPHDFVSSAKTENISITGIIELTTGMVLSVRAKSNTINTTITIESLNVTFVKI